ncbi:TnpV protein [Roseburia intestinalis]
MTDKIKETEVLEKHIIGENGISYTLGEDGLYYPDLQLPEGTHYEIGRYGRMRAEYLKEYHRALYLELLLDGNLNEYLHQTDEECYQMMERLVEQMKAKHGVTEQLKSENQMQWVGMMNNIRQCAEEVVLRDIVYV